MNTSSSPSISCASSAASMSSFSSDSSSMALSKSAQTLRATALNNKPANNNNNNNESLSNKNKRENSNNQNIFVDNFNGKNNNNHKSYNNNNNFTNESPSMAILARVKKLQHETYNKEENSNFRFMSSTLNSFENFSDMIMIHHEASDETTALNVDGSDTNVDTLRVEKISASLKSNI